MSPASSTTRPLRDILYNNIIYHIISLVNKNIKISNFGISAIHKDYKKQYKYREEDLFSNKTIVGRVEYASPEVKKGDDYD